MFLIQHKEDTFLDTWKQMNISRNNNLSNIILIKKIISNIELPEYLK